MLWAVLAPAMPPMTKLEQLVLEGAYDPRLGFDEQCERIREWLRAEIAECQIRAKTSENGLAQTNGAGRGTAQRTHFAPLAGNPPPNPPE